MPDESSPSTEALRPLDPTVIQTLLDQQAQFLAFLSRRLPSRAVAEDLLQHGLERALKHVDQVEDPGKITAWFYQVLRNVLIDFYRAHASDDRKMQSWLNELVAAGEEVQHAPDDLKNGVCTCFESLLPTLKPEYSEILRQIDLEGQELNQVAERLGLTRNNATVRLHRARTALRKSLQLSCGACSQHGCLECSCSDPKS